MQGNNTLGIKKCQPPLLQIQNILKKLEFLVTIHFQLSNRLPHLDSKKNATETQKKFVCARVIFGHLGHLKVLQHLIQEVFPVITMTSRVINKAGKQLTAGSGIQQEKGTPHFSRLLLSLLQSKYMLKSQSSGPWAPQQWFCNR